MSRHLSNHILLYSATAATALIAGTVVAFSLISSRKPLAAPARKTIPSPRTTLLPHLSPAQIQSLGYPPDALPGARDVSTPYGWMRVYEWGPADGRRVVLVHGDSTPSPIYVRVANELVARGCRVLTFDLWGRGYSDTPLHVQHDSRLYGQQIFYAISSSSVHWSGSPNGSPGSANARIRFSLVGFSMGSSVVLDFFAHQPHLIDSVVLMAPAGLVRTVPPEYKSLFYRYPSLTTKTDIRALIGKLLAVDLAPVPAGDLRGRTIDSTDEEAVNGFTPAGALQFQFDHHRGLIDSFLSTIRYGPYQGQEAVWQRASRIIKGDPSADLDMAGHTAADTPLWGGKLLMLCGADDYLVPAADVEEDLVQYFGCDEDTETERKHFMLKIVPGGHDFPWFEGKRVGEILADFWGL